MSQKEVGNIEQKSESKRTVWNWLWSALKTIFLVFIVLWLSLLLLIQLPAVQNWIIGQLASSFHEKTGHHLYVSQFHLQFFDRASLADATVLDPNQNELLYAGKVNINFQNPIRTYFFNNNRLVIEGVRVEDARIYQHRAVDEWATNFTKLIERFQGDDKADKPSSYNAKDVKKMEERQEASILFDLKEMYIKNSEFLRLDSLRGAKQLFQVKEALIRSEKFDYQNQLFLFDQLICDSLRIDLDMFDAGPSLDSLWAANVVQEGMPNETVEAQPPIFKIQDLQVKNSNFKLDNYYKAPVKTTPSHVLDWHHFEVHDIHINANDFRISNWDFEGCLHRLSGRTSSGFEIENLSSSYTHVSEQEVTIEDVSLKTNLSHVKGDIELRYSQFPDFKDFVNQVYLDVNFRNSNVAIGDIIVFAPGLSKLNFFNQNRNKRFVFYGHATDIVKNLNCDDIFISFGKENYLKGQVRFEDITQPQQTFMELEIEASENRMSNLRSIIPNFPLPKNFDKLGLVSFSGKYAGKYKDFDIEGDFSTDLGNAVAQMHLNLIDEPKYNGRMQLLGFDLGRWTGDPNLGTIDMQTQVYDGNGFQTKDLHAKINTKVQSIFYKGFEYKNLNLVGRVDTTLFNGDFSIEDESIDLAFDGVVNLETNPPIIDIDAHVNKIHFQELNLTKKELKLAGDFKLNIQDYRLNNLIAAAELKDVKLWNKDTVYTLEYADAYAKSDTSSKSMEIKSDLLDFYMEGAYNLTEVIPEVSRKLQKDYSQYIDTAYIYTSEIDTAFDQEFSAKLKVYNLQNWQELFAPKLSNIIDLEADLSWSASNDFIDLNAYTPYLAYDIYEFFSPNVYFVKDLKLSNAVIGIDSCIFNNNFKLNSTYIQSDIDKDTIRWRMDVAQEQISKQSLNLEGKTFKIKDKFAFNLNNKYLTIFADDWDIPNNNLLVLGKQYFRTKDFYVSHGVRKIELLSKDDKGIELTLDGIDFSLLNDLIVYDKIDFAGALSANFKKTNLYDDSYLDLSVLIDSLHFNGDDYGILDLQAKAKNENSDIFVNASIEHEVHKIFAEGFLYTADFDKSKDFYSLEIEMQQYPFKTLQYFIDNLISETEGSVTGAFTFTGKVDKPILEGKARLDSCRTFVDFLGIEISAHDQWVRTYENNIDLTDLVINDIYQNSAEVAGVITHDYFRDLGLDLRVLSDNFLLLNTKNTGKSYYYGHCMGKAQVDMLGSVANPNINIIATNTDDTDFFIRTDINSEAGGGFFTYGSFDEATEQKEIFETPKGVSLFLDLTANEDANVSIIIDEETGDIIKGNGAGNIQFFLSETGEIEMFGDYTIDQGEYFYTAQTIINKRFPIESGSTIRWEGDPYRAFLDIKATYPLYASPAGLVGQSADQDPSLQNTTEVILQINLDGFLVEPKLSFDILFPQLTGQARVVVDNQMSILHANPSEMYEQAGALIIFGTFISPNANNSNLGALATVSTISEFLSSQFSGMLSGILRSAVEDVEFIDDVGVRIGYNAIQNAFQENSSGLERGEIRLNTSAQIFDRLEVDLGTNYGVGNATGVDANAQGTYLTGNFAIEYYLTEDRRLILRAYSLTEQGFEGRQFRSGFGLRYNKQFKDYDDFLNSLKSIFKKKTKNPEN